MRVADWLENSTCGENRLRFFSWPICDSAAPRADAFAVLFMWSHPVESRIRWMCSIAPQFNHFFFCHVFRHWCPKWPNGGVSGWVGGGGPQINITCLLQMTAVPQENMTPFVRRFISQSMFLGLFHVLANQRKTFVKLLVWWKESAGQ